MARSGASVVGAPGRVASYRDQWLSEGLAEFTAALVLELSSGRDAADRFWELRRLEVLDRGRGGVPNDEAGAITQGFRLATTRSPAAASASLYSKGAYVVHMLRMMMREDGAADPDGAFRAMMQDFVENWAGKNPSTDDFQVVAERHLHPRMNLAGDGRLTWFFDQWVHGTHIPTLASALEATDLGGNRYRIAGTIAQAGVPEGFPDARARLPRLRQRPHLEARHGPDVGPGDAEDVR
jgi:aminopeptidase N